MPAKEVGYLKDHFIESLTKNWRCFRISENSPHPGEFCQISQIFNLRKWRSWRYVFFFGFKIEEKSFRDGSQDICTEM